MKALTFSFLLILLSIFSACSDTTPGKARIVFEKYDNGNEKLTYQYFTDTADMNDPHLYQEFHENGNLKIQGKEIEFIREGEWRFYYDDNTPMAILNFRNDTLNGPITLYNTQGKLTDKDNAILGVLKGQNQTVIEFIHRNICPTQNTERRDSIDIVK